MTLLRTDLLLSPIRNDQKHVLTPFGASARPLLGKSSFTGLFAEVGGGYSLGNGVRRYLPTLHRFVMPDTASPFGKGGLNSYVYCYAEPVNSVDPTGHSPVKVISKIMHRLEELRLERALKRQRIASMGDKLSGLLRGEKIIFEKFIAAESTGAEAEVVKANLERLLRRQWQHIEATSVFRQQLLSSEQALSGKIIMEKNNVAARLTAGAFNPVDLDFYKVMRKELNASVRSDPKSPFLKTNLIPVFEGKRLVRYEFYK